MRNISCLQQGRDETTEAYYRRFEAAKSMADFLKLSCMTHVELNRTHAGGDENEGTKRFQDMCLLVSADSKLLSGIWNDLNINTLLGIYNYPETPTNAYDVLCWCKNPTPPLQTHAPPGVVTLV